MPSNSRDRGPDAQQLQHEPPSTHEVVPGPFGPDQTEAGGPYEWLTPQRDDPEPLHRDFPTERAAG